MIQHLALLATASFLPSALASCSPYLNELPALSSAEPEKCWTCPNANSGFGGGGQKPFADWEDEGTSSWENFYCKYTRGEGQDADGVPYKSSSIFCQYDGKGKLRVKDAYCANQAVPVPNCTPAKPYSGESEVCCGDNCKLTTDQCYYCPPKAAKYVDVTADQSFLTCEYRWDALKGDKFRFDAKTGAPLNSSATYLLAYGGPAPRREGCTAKPTSVPGADCPSGPTHDQCVEEAKQDAYRSFEGWNRCPSKADYCKRRTNSDDCWACPTISGPDAVAETFPNANQAYCEYYKKNAAGSLEEAKTRCVYDMRTGAPVSIPWTEKFDNTHTCPPQAGKDLTCLRLKNAQ